MKLVIIINGHGSSGKDTVVKILSRQISVWNISSIDPIKKIVAYGGYKEEDKRKVETRDLLSTVKQAFIKYNDLPNRYLLGEYEKFTSSPAEVLFVHIREPEEIEKFKSSIDLPCVTLLISDGTVHDKTGVYAEDVVNNYDYDFICYNNSNLEALERNFLKLWGGIKGYGRETF